MTSIKDLCTCGHAAQKHGDDFNGECLARDGAYAECPCEKFRSVKPDGWCKCGCHEDDHGPFPYWDDPELSPRCQGNKGTCPCQAFEQRDTQEGK